MCHRRRATHNRQRHDCLEFAAEQVGRLGATGERATLARGARRSGGLALLLLDEELLERAGGFVLLLLVRLVVAVEEIATSVTTTTRRKKRMMVDSGWSEEKETHENRNGTGESRTHTCFRIAPSSMATVHPLGCISTHLVPSCGSPDRSQRTHTPGALQSHPLGRYIIYHSGGALRLTQSVPFTPTRPNAAA